MKRKLISFLILAFYTHAYSQNSEEFIPSDAHSPKAAELSSYGFMPVSYYTGREQQRTTFVWSLLGDVIDLQTNL